MDYLVVLAGFLALLQAGKKLICQNRSFFRVYGIEIGRTGTGIQKVIEHFLRSFAWENDLIFNQMLYLKTR